MAAAAPAPRGDADDVGAVRQVIVLVPDHGDLGANLAEGHGHVAVAVGAGEDDDGGLHGDGMLPCGGRTGGGDTGAGVMTPGVMSPSR